MPKKVLIISYYFPPRKGVASLRIRGLAKYLPEFGWDPIILTAELPSRPDSRFNVIEIPDPGSFKERIKRKLGFRPDDTFLEIGEKLSEESVERRKVLLGLMIKMFRKNLNNIFPDGKKYLMPFALQACESLFEKEHIDAIISSSFPIVTHLIAHKIKKKHGIPWIADLRDLWSQNHYFHYLYFGRFIHQRLEVKTLSIADAIVTVSDPLANKLRELHKGKKTFTITNGFDPEEIGTAPLTKEFTITYTGLLYDGKQDPGLLFKAIDQLLKEGYIDRKSIKVRFFSPKEYWLIKKIKKYELEDVVEMFGTVPRDEVLYHQRSSQILLVLNWNDPREEGIYTGKLFEYLTAQRPILAIGGPGGVVSEFLNQTNAGVHTSNLDDLIFILKNWYKEWKETGQVKYHGISEEISKYSHREMAHKFAKILDNIVEGG